MAVVSGATPKVLVPNTLIVNDKVALEWVYTGKDGRLAI